MEEAADALALKEAESEDAESSLSTTGKPTNVHVFVTLNQILLEICGSSPQKNLL